MKGLVSEGQKDEWEEESGRPAELLAQVTLSKEEIPELSVEMC